MTLDTAPLLLTLKLAAVTTAILYLLGLPVAWFLSQTRLRMKPVLEAIFALPLVLPPSVLGFYFLLAFSRQGWLGGVWENLFGHQLAFSFDGLVLGSVIFSLPFMVHPLQAGFNAVPHNLIDASYSLGKSKTTTMLMVILPAMKSSLLTGGVLAFAHTVGEFGVVLMIGGSIDSETKVASIAIYDLVESLDYQSAHLYAAILFVFSFAILMAVYLVNKKLDLR
ncbi:molybdate ABC transporter, inner membrane subunit [Chlorobium limicola DSM 245]|uniref:Molybdenum transport system permease n=1 Tax=Chlorobium limicola (strain DSM 245 / NBRC 103803 / 6330) TaxID=290315 RepID=B3EFI2_CHLL2|nr:molybdate ABC transporter permease subunit [Chlorobium limicola]ACD89465.1 molybdate ABC transporter, inner membrane subunit [Chlorobium limicola DSM 245]